jgi:hypothetical protein
MAAGWCCEGGLAASGWGRDRRCLVPVRTCWLLVEALRCRPSGWGHFVVECGDADQVVNGGGHLEPGPVAVLADVSELSAGADGFDPSEGFLNPFSDPLADLIAGVAGGSPIDRRATVRRVLGDVRGEPGRPNISDERFWCRSSCPQQQTILWVG